MFSEWGEASGRAAGQEKIKEVDNSMMKSSAKEVSGAMTFW